MSDDIERLVPMREVLTRVPVAERTIYRWVQLGQFPQPRKLGQGGRVAWLESELVAWMRGAGQDEAMP